MNLFLEDNLYRPITGRFADNQYWPISTLISADVVYTVGKYKFYYMA